MNATIEGSISLIRELLHEIKGKLKTIRLEEQQIKEQYTAKLSELSEMKNKLEAQERHLAAVLALQGEPTELSRDALEADTQTKLGTPRRSMPLQDEVYSLLKALDNELHYKDLTHQLLARGIDISGKDPAGTLLSRIFDDPRFVRPKRGVYALKEWYPKGVKSVGKRTRRRTSRSGQRRGDTARQGKE